MFGESGEYQVSENSQNLCDEDDDDPNPSHLRLFERRSEAIYQAIGPKHSVKEKNGNEFLPSNGFNQIINHVR